ncbi:MAG TPA: 2-C-methyl-D-erythritol 2,4-cyclodiphosphate synthase [Acidimicrobiia bacterium]|nr:2-C-methyl-D-erythritol 2,4-cyclodiphosphate synthase [Acidimicrobiia bacterium]
MNLRVGLGFDVHAFGGSGPLVLGGVVIPNGPGLVGHSDADVIAHAVADALLGAAGLPDLGTLFPASDDAHRDASSIGLLREVVEHVAGEGWRVANVDVVVAIEAPRIGPHVPAMAALLAEVVAGAVSVKPKRTEGVGAVGRGEGVAAWAVALLVDGPDAGESVPVH